MVPMKKELAEQQDRMKEITSEETTSLTKEAYKIHYNCKKNAVHLVEAMVAADTNTRPCGSGDNSAETDLEKTKHATKIL